MTCPDCARARRFAVVNGGSWWRRHFGECWACFKRRGDWWRTVSPFVLAFAAVVIIALGFLARGRLP